MNNKVLAGVVGAVVVVGVAIYLFTMQKPATNETSSTNDGSNQSSQPQSTSSKKSLKDLMALGSQKCQYQDGVNTGSVYTANGKSRMDFTTTANGQTMGSHSIIDNETYYTWVDGQTTGLKFSVSNAGTDDQTQGFDVNKSLDYNCNSWSLDSSVFTPPSNVTFTDYSSFTIPPGN